MQKKTLILSVTAILLFAAACKHKSYYTCMCNIRIGKDTADSVWALGEIPQSDAYNYCHAHEDSLTKCYMLIQN